MSLPLRYSTADQTVLLGPFLDDTDGKTPETGLSIANTDIKINKHNGTTFSSKNSGGATHIANGYYYATLDATDTDTIGRMVIAVNMTGALPVWHEFEVMSQQEYDAKFGSGYASVNVVQVAGTAQTARDLGANLDTTVSSRAPASTALSNATWTDAKAGYLDAAISSRSTLTADGAADAVWDEALSGHLTSGSTGAALNAAGSAGDPWSTSLPGAYGSGTAGYILGNRLDATVSSRAPASTALSNTTWTDTKAGYLDAAISSRSTLTASDVWDYTTRTLTSFGTLVSDIWAYSTRTLSAFSTSLALSVWDVLESAIAASNSIGVKVKTNLDAAISAVKSQTDKLTFSGSDVVATLDGEIVTVGTNNDKTGYSLATAPPAAGDIADAVWDEALSGHGVAGSAGEAQSKLDASVSSRSTLTAADVWDYASGIGQTVLTLLLRAYRLLANKMTYNTVTGDLSVKNESDVEIGTGSVTSLGDVVTREKITWL